MLKAILIASLAIVAVAAAVVAFATWRFGAAIDGEVDRLVAGASRRPVVVSEDMLAPLPPPVRRYLSWSGVVGKPIPSVVRLTQSGRIRSAADAAWMPFAAEETYATDPPGFVWRAWLPRRWLPVVAGRDAYRAGQGSILMKLLALAPVADERGDALGAAGLMRYLNEMMWFPAATLGANVTWTAIDAQSARVTIVDGAIGATGIWFFDDDGRPVAFRARRYNTATARVEVWETPVGAYGRFAGLNLPTRGTAVWKRPGGDFTYIELEVTGIAYE